MRPIPFPPDRISQRWFERKALARYAYTSPADAEWWVALYWDVAGPIYRFLLDAGLLLLDEGDYYVNARIAPLGTPPRDVQAAAWMAAGMRPKWNTFVRQRYG